MFVSLKNSYIEILIFNVVIFEDVAFGRQEDDDGRAPMMGLVPFIEGM